MSEQTSIDRVLGVLQGHTIVSIEGMEKGGEEVKFTRSDGAVVEMSHLQDCCEHVRIVDVNGDPSDLIGSPLVLAVESQSGDWPVGDDVESYTWTFYRFRTANGDVDVRWLGESNGYYSESVDVFQVDNDTGYDWDRGRCAAQRARRGKR